jgi:phosphoribosylanthranilate isomerase
VSVLAKICGLSTAETIAVAVEGGAGMVGFNFYAPSPRAVTPEQAGALTRNVPSGVDRVGLFVDADDTAIGTAIAQAALDILQLHGSETPARVAELKQKFKLPAMKAIKLSSAADLDEARRYDTVADWLLFDAKVPEGMNGALPGGNGLAFDWQLLAGKTFRRPWLLSGGLDADNLAEAVRTSGAHAVDVSSGVESAPGFKDARRIRAFLDVARGL